MKPFLTITSVFLGLLARMQLGRALLGWAGVFNGVSSRSGPVPSPH